MGIRGGVSRNTLANANKVRDWRIYADFAQALIKIARPVYGGKLTSVRGEFVVDALITVNVHRPYGNQSRYCQI
jgi:hypothetical protein